MSGPRRGQPARFPTTAWSLVERAGHEGQCQREALGQLLARYLPALVAHLVFRRGFHPEVADDMVQEFITGKIVEKDLIARADQELGKFRTFLLTALDRFLVDSIRARQAKKRMPDGGRLVSIGDRADRLQGEAGPSEAFDVAWARGVLEEALGRMQQQCESSGRPEVWGIFECRVLEPVLSGAEPAGYDELVERFGLQSPSQASNVLITAKRMYARTLRSVVGEYAYDDGEIESEIEELREVLAAGAA